MDISGAKWDWWCGRLIVIDDVMIWRAAKNLGDYTMFKLQINNGKDERLAANSGDSNRK